MTEIFKAKTVDDAKKNASLKFGVSVDEIQFKVLKEAKKGFLGLGSANAEVEATYTPIEVSEPAKKSSELSESISAETEDVPAQSPEKEEVSPQLPEKKEVSPQSPEKEVFLPCDENFDDIDEYSLDNFSFVEDETLLNPKAKIARDYILSVLRAMDIKADAKIYQNDTGAFIQLEGGKNNNGTIIGRRGETLDALQYLSSMISNKGDKEYFRITVDCSGHREKRKATLEQLAAKVARNVLKTGRSQPLEPMNPYERRVIHSAISNIEGVSSRSVGEEPYRKIIVSSTNPKKKNSDKYNRNFNNKKKPHRQTKDIDLSTSFEKDYKKPKPEDSIEGGLYGKIEF